MGGGIDEYIHSVRVHRFTSVEIEVLEVGRDLLGEVALHTGLETLDLLLTLAGFLELLDDLL